MNSSEDASSSKSPALAPSTPASTEESKATTTIDADFSQKLLSTLYIRENSSQTGIHNDSILRLEKLHILLLPNELIVDELAKPTVEKIIYANSGEGVDGKSSNHEKAIVSLQSLDILHLQNALSEVNVWTAEIAASTTNKAPGISNVSAPETTTIYLNPASGSDSPKIIATGQIPSDMEDVYSQADEASRIPDRGSREQVFLNDLVPPPKKAKRRRRRKKRRWCRCCCCKKKKKVVDIMNANGDGPNLNPVDSDSDYSSDSTMSEKNDAKSSGNKSKSEQMSHSLIGTRVRLPNTSRRTRIPDRPNVSLNLWGLLKNSLGKELSKIPMPVNFSEPLSMLQRLTEDYEYSDILDKAAKCTDSCEQMCYVAAFTVSSYASTSVRTAKPFNPLLGETYEWDRTEDLGWRSISEQTSHHPPTAALYCESLKNGWKCWQEFTMTSKFKGNSLEIIPLGVAHLTFEASGNHYTWRKVTTMVRNIIIGKLWVEQIGDMVITNHTTGDKCNLTYVPASFFSKKEKEVKGTVKNKSGNIKWVINGSWDSKVEAAQIKNVGAGASSISNSKPTTNVSEKSFITALPTVLWVRRPAPPEAEKYYNFTEFAVHMNELEPDVAPTDSRLRPDQRLMENGKWDEANAEKLRLEDKQRNARKLNSYSQQTISTLAYQPPTWFQKEKDTVEGTTIYTYKGEYWKCKSDKNWSRCPDIF